MSTIHTMFTGKTDSYIDAAMERVESEERHEDMRKRIEWIAKYGNDNMYDIYKAKGAFNPDHPDHPDYMRMVVHQMD